MSQAPRGGFSRRRLVRWGSGLLGAGAGLVLTHESGAVPLSGVRATVAAAAVDVRSGPASTRSRIGGLNRGAVVTCLATSGTWFQITFGTGTGWVSNGNLTLVVTTPAVTVTRGSTAVKAVCLTFDAGDDRRTDTHDHPGPDIDPRTHVRSVRCRHTGRVAAWRRRVGLAAPGSGRSVK